MAESGSGKSATASARRSPSQRSSASSARSDAEQVKLLHCKRGVYMYRSKDGKDAQRGYLTLFEKRPSTRYIAWAPESAIPSEEMDAYVRVDASIDDPLNVSMAYTMLLPGWSASTGVTAGETATAGSGLASVADVGICSPLSSVRFVLVHPPSLTQWHGSVVISLKDGVSWPPLWFQPDDGDASYGAGSAAREQWGGTDLIVWLRRVADVVPSSTNNSLYAIDPTAEDFLELHLVRLGEEDDELLKEKYGAQAWFAGHPYDRPDATGASDPSRQPLLSTGRNAFPQSTRPKEFTWRVLERFSRLTRGARTATEFMRNMSWAPTGISSSAASGMRNNDNTMREMCDDYLPAKLYLARWAADASNHRFVLPGEEAAAEAAAAASSAREQMEMTVWREEQTELGVFEMLNAYTDMPRFSTHRIAPVTAEQWFSWMSLEGRLTVDGAVVRKAIFSGGIEPDLRPAVWPFLLGVFPWTSTEAERADILVAKMQVDGQTLKEYEALKQIWQAPEVKATDDFAEQTHRIEKDVMRTDRTVPEYASNNNSRPNASSRSGLYHGNANLMALQSILTTYNYYNVGHGYVQGMSDLVSPLYAVLRDEPLTFWCFAAFMSRMERNFSTDQVGMHHQLTTLEQLVHFMRPRFHRHLERADALHMFFCFRWLLIWFKREFHFDNVLRLWEVLWTDRYSHEFPIFIVLAILDQHQVAIMDHLGRFDEILKYVNDLSTTIDLDKTLCRAEILFLEFQHAVRILDEQGTAIHASHSRSATEATASVSVEAGSSEQPPRESLSEDWVEASATTTESLCPVTDELRALLSA